MATNTKYRNYEVIVEEMKPLANLIKLGEMEFDAILGMDGYPLVLYMWIVGEKVSFLK